MAQAAAEASLAAQAEADAGKAAQATEEAVAASEARKHAKAAGNAAEKAQSAHARADKILEPAAMEHIKEAKKRAQGAKQKAAEAFAVANRKAEEQGGDYDEFLFCGVGAKLCLWPSSPDPPLTNN